MADACGSCELDVAPHAAAKAAATSTAGAARWLRGRHVVMTANVATRLPAPIASPAIRGSGVRRLISYDPSMEARDLAVGLAGGRIAIGVVSLLAPGLVGRAMIGPAGDSGGTRRFLRVLGARDLALGIGVLAALDRNAPVRGWLRASAVVDGLDAVGSLLARRHLRPIVVPAAAGGASPGALLSGWLARQLDA
jgi:hypothetical protein